jgi:hypothetical protein
MVPDDFDSHCEIPTDGLVETIGMRCLDDHFLLFLLVGVVDFIKNL